MSPADAINQLLSLHGWTELRIALEVGTSQPTINRIKKGASPAYETGVAIVLLAQNTLMASNRRESS